MLLELARCLMFGRATFIPFSEGHSSIPDAWRMEISFDGEAGWPGKILGNGLSCENGNLFTVWLK